ncbi:MAG: Rpn family recombination-promoting nuclease/putative transposase [Lachnospiraceae bacterium]|nr:Rpn family recombination-promoting nuclease/putative transposase [Lachnospiraceae bacterium]
MGKIDHELNHYFQDNRTFADMVNLCVYDGEPVILPQDLEDDCTVLYPTDGKDGLRERRIDVSKRCTTGYSFCIYCLENESKISYIMPVRNMEFEAARYREQLKKIAAGHEKTDYRNWAEFSSKFTKDDRLQPVIMLVLYWSRKPWDGARSLTEMLDIPEENKERIAPFLQNYRLNLINMYDLEHVEMCQSQLKYLLQLLKKDQNKEEIYQEVQGNPAYQKLDQETGRMMAVLLRDEKLEKYIEEQQEEGDETFNMCKALDDMRQEAMERGEVTGEDRFARLTNLLLADERMDDLHLAITNPATRRELYREYQICYNDPC